MFDTVAIPLWLLIPIGLFAALSFLERIIGPGMRWFFRKRAERVVAELNKRLDRPIEPFKLARRFDKAPKPMYYPPDFLVQSWQGYLTETGASEDKVDPDDFIRWGFRQLIGHRVPRYQAIADKWGAAISAEEVAKVRSADDFNMLIAAALDKRTVALD